MSTHLPRILAMNWKDIKHPQAGGAEVFTHEVLTRLVNQGYDVTLIAPNPGKSLDPKETVDGVKTIRKGNVFTVSIHTFFYYLKHRDNYDIVIDQINVIPFFTPIYVRKPKFFLIHQVMHKVWFYQLPKWIGIFGFLAEKLYLRVYRNQIGVTVSNSTKNALLKLGFKEDKIHIVNEGLDIPIKNLLHPKHDIKNIMYFGSVRPMKGVIDIVKAFEILQKSVPTVSLTIQGHGHGNYKDKILKYIEQHNIPNIMLEEGISQEKKHEAYDNTDLILMASVLEGWGLVASEAHARGIPTVVYNTRGLRDSTTHLYDGYVTNKNTPDELAKGIQYFIKNPATYLEAQFNAINGVQGLNWDTTTNQFIDLISAMTEVENYG